MSAARPLRRLRVAAGLSQAALAARAGVSRPLVSAVEAGRHLPRIDAALALAGALGTTVEGLFGRIETAPVDAITGAPPAAGAPLRIGVVGGRMVTARPRAGDDGWDAVDGIAGALADERTLHRAPGLVVAGCEPALVLLERLLRERGTRAVAIGASSAAALEALAAGRLHAAAVHFPAGAPPAFATVPTVRLHLARWRVGLAAPAEARRGWWKAALGGRVPVVQREPGAAVQAAFERALRARRRAVPGPRVDGHLAAGRRAVLAGMPAVTIEPAAAAVGAVFHPLEVHEVELWIDAGRIAEPGVERLLELLASAPYRRTLAAVGGYDLAAAGSRVA